MKAKLVLMFYVLIIPTLLFADPFDPFDDVDDVPFDGGIIVLIGIAVLYGVVRIINHRKKEKAMVAARRPC